MARLRIGDVVFGADLVVFDKDGTLLDFEHMWGGLLRAEVEALSATGGDALAQALYAGVGYDPASRRTEAYGPWAMATTEQVLTILAATLYRHGYTWPAAWEAVLSTWRSLTAVERLPALVRPTADLTVLFGELRHAGTRIAVLTTDNRQATEQTLKLLGVADLADAVICGDDGMPVKPAPEAVWALCRRWSIPVERTVVVGDTVFDLQMGRRAGAGLTVGVLSGAGTREALEPEADVIVPSVGDIAVLA